MRKLWLILFIIYCCIISIFIGGEKIFRKLRSLQISKQVSYKEGNSLRPFQNNSLNRIGNSGINQDSDGDGVSDELDREPFDNKKY
jgi:hypothetical protein